MPLLAALQAAAAGGKGGITDINLGLTIWTIVLFILFAALLFKLGWKPLLAMIEEREKRIVEAVDSAHRAEDQAQALLVQQKEVLREAGQQRESMLKQAFADAEQVRANLMAQARAESARLIEKAREQIARETEVAVRELRAQVADLAILAAGKIVTSSLTPEMQRTLVEEFLESLPADKG
jgi:F-type H+-transporting ATPase subunit b